jgi:hypothetical protein
VPGEIFSDYLGVIVRVALVFLGAVATYGLVSYRVWYRAVVRRSTLSDLQSVPDAAAKEIRTAETIFSYNYVSIILLAIGLTLLGTGSTKLFDLLQNDSEIPAGVFFAVTGGIVLLAISLTIFRFRKRIAEATLESLKRKEQLWKAVYAAMGPDAVIERFQKRKKRLVPLTLVPIVLAVISISLSIIFHGFEQTKWAIEEVAVVVGGFLLLGSGIIFLGVSFRCPVCSEPPWASVPGAGRGMTFDPITCSTCGSPLHQTGLLTEEVPPPEETAAADKDEVASSAETDKAADIS